MCTFLAYPGVSIAIKSIPVTYQMLLSIHQKTIHGKCRLFKIFTVFYSTPNLFLWIVAWSINNVSLQKCHSESFTVNNYYPLKTCKFSAMGVFQYTVYCQVLLVTLITHPWGLYLVCKLDTQGHSLRVECLQIRHKLNGCVTTALFYGAWSDQSRP